MDVIAEPTQRRRWMPGIAVLALVGSLSALAGAATAVALDDEDQPDEVFCSSDALVGPNDEVFGRSNSQDCQFVDYAGNLLQFTASGDLLCYDETTSVVPCDQPGARPPG